MGVLGVPVLVVLLCLVSHVMCQCKCEDMSARMLDMEEQVDSLRLLVSVLNMKVGDMVKKDHEREMAEIKSGGQHLSNTIPDIHVDANKKIQELSKRVAAGKVRTDSLQNDMEVLKNDNEKFRNEIREKVNTTFTEVLEGIKEHIINDMISPWLVIYELSYLRDRLDKIEKWVIVDDSVLQLLKPREAPEPVTGGALESHFVNRSNSSSGNFSVNVTGDGEIVCGSGGCLTITNDTEHFNNATDSDTDATSELEEIDPPLGKALASSSEKLSLNVTEGDHVVCPPEGCVTSMANGTEPSGDITDIEMESGQKVISTPSGLAMNSSTGNLAVNITEDSCPSNISSPEECLSQSANGTTSVANVTDSDKSSEQNEIGVSLGQVLNAVIVKLAGIEKRIESMGGELILLSGKVDAVERNISELNVQDRLVNSEAFSTKAQPGSDRWTELESWTSAVNRTMEGLEVQVQNLTDRIERAERNEQDLPEALMLEKNRTDTALAEVSSQVRTFQSTAVHIEEFKNTTSDIVRNLTDIAHRVFELNRSVEVIRDNVTASVQLLTAAFQHDTSLLNASVADNLRLINQNVMKDVVNMNRTLQKRSVELAADVGERIQQLNTTLEGEVQLLSMSMMNSVASLNDSLKNDVELLNESLTYELETLNNTIVERVVTLSKHVETLNETLRDELGVVNVSLADNMRQLNTTMMNMGKSQRLIQSWHPDDDLPCPGLLFLGRNRDLVLTTENITFRSPHLPEEPIPVGREVVFRCENPGTSRLLGEQVLSCFAGRWSARPPTCEPLPTIQELRSRMVVASPPSITYNVSQGTGLVINKYGVLVLTPGVGITFTCVYPRSHGTVTWKHNGTVVDSTAATWARGADADYAYVLGITDAQWSDSGTYTCVIPNGRNHSVELQVEGIQCEPVAAPGNGSMVVIKGSSTLGSRIEFNCHLGFKLVGVREVTCVTPGEWSDAVPVCQAIDDYRPPRTACTQPKLSNRNLGIDPVQMYYEDKAKVSYVCKDGRRPVGKATSTCMKGTWMGAEPMCD